MKSARLIILGLLCLSLAWTEAASAQDPAAAPKYPSMAPVAQYLETDRAGEIALAKTAGPKAVSDDASVLVLGKDGYETAVQGTNGFTCYVGRSWEKDFDDPEFWNPNIRTPQCWNAAAVTSMLPAIRERTQWVLTGVSKDEMLARTKAEIAAHQIGVPAPGNMEFMLSKQQYISDAQPGVPPNWYPHVMMFLPTGPGSVGSEFGANHPGSEIAAQNSDIMPFTTFFVLVPKWSDGTPTPYIAGADSSAQHHH